MTSKIKVDNITDQDDNNIINESGDVITVGAAGDTVAVAGNIVKSNALQASDGGNIVNQSGTTITIGASGDTVSLASGASQSGFGRSGSVNWQTGSLKTSTFTAADGEGYFINSGSAITMNLPAGSAGAIVAISDYARNFSTYNFTISANGSEKIGGVADDATLNIDGQAATFVYVDSTKGWINVQNAEDTETGVVPAYIAATGGTVTTVCTNYKVHTFTGPGTFCISAGAGPLSVLDYMVVAGGGGAGGSTNPGGGGAGGGAGGFRESKVAATSGCWTASPLAATSSLGPFTPGAVPVTVGAGGTGKGPGAYANGFGSNSIFSTIISVGGGDGGMNAPGTRPVTKASDGTPSTSSYIGGQGGSGGGGGFFTHLGGLGNEPPVSPPQGNSGGTGSAAPKYSGGGGGGAGAAGCAASPTAGGNGGAGVTTNITGSPVARAGGGGGASTNSTDGSGGSGGGGSGTSPGGTGGAGSANTGGGGGAGGSPGNATGGAGGSGVVVIRYRFQA